MQIPNFAVIDQPTADAPGVYRGAQPISSQDWYGLKDLGVTQIIKLNTDEEGSDDEALTLGMKVMKCPITLTQQLLTEPDLTNLACAVSFIEPGTFVHCGSTARTQHALLIGESKGAGGEDRTGVCVALYRVKQGWPKSRAYAEMKEHGFHNILFGLAKAWNDLTSSQ